MKWIANHGLLEKMQRIYWVIQTTEKHLPLMWMMKIKKMGVTIRDAIGREQKPVLINESGFYSLILSSKFPKAKEFKRWVTKPKQEEICIC